uniref:RUN domain-containing protein n=1 Tax=Macrostomum lignano TaxID=282301 RepID=A0A1I8IJU1_9PLAT
GRPVGVGRSHSDLQHGRRYIAAQQQQQLPSLAFLRDSLPLADPSSVAAAAAAASASSATTTADAAGDSGIGTAVGDGSVSASAASNFVCRNCGHPQHQQQLARRLAGGKQKRSQSLDTTAASAAAAAADEAEAPESKSAERLRRAARRRVARATDSSRKQRGGLGGSGAKRTLSEPHRLCSVSSAAAAGGTAANSGSGAGASGSGVGYEMTQSLTDSQEEESSAAAAATPHRSTTPQAASSSARRDYPDDSDDGGGGFRAKKSVSFCDRIQFHSPKGQAAASPTAGSAAAGQIWRGGVGSTVDLGAAAAVLPSGDSPHRQQTLLRRPLSLQLNYDVQVIPQQVGLYGDNDSPPLVFCGSPVGSPRRTAESTAAAASQQQRQSRLDRLSQLVSDAIRGVNDLILAATASPLAAGTADASDQQRQQQRLSSVLSQSLCPPLHGLLTDELLSSGGSGGSGPGSRLSFGRSRSQLWQLIEETCKPSGQPASRRLNEVLRQVRSVGGLSTERLKFNAFVAACLNSKQLSAWFHHAASSESILKRYYKPGAFLRSAQTVHCELFADLSTSLELLNSHSFGIELAASASSSVTAAGQNNSRSKPAGQQPLKARHDIKTQQPPPPPPPQHQRPAARPRRPGCRAGYPGLPARPIPPPPRQASLLAVRPRQRPHPLLL